MSIAASNKSTNGTARVINKENWPSLIHQSDWSGPCKTIMSMLSPQQNQNGSVVFTVNEDDAFMITARFRQHLKRAVESLLGRDTDIHFSIAPNQPKPAEHETSPNETDPQGARQFRKRLGWLIKEAPDAVRMTVTPEMAAVMLERNSSDEWRNRPESEPGLRRIVRAMAKGNWRYTGETIIFSVDGYLLNGQHRLHGCVDSKTPFEVLVAFGVDNDAFKYMDVGIARTPGHIFAIENIPNYNFTASVCRLVMDYMANPKWGGAANSRAENDELLDFYHRHPRIADSYSVARRLNKAGLLSPRWAGALYYICGTKSRSMADEFFEKLATGVGITSVKDPVHVLRERLIKSSQSSNDNKEAGTYLAAYTVLAWNAARNGQTRTLYRWRGANNPNESFPRAI